VAPAAARCIWSVRGRRATGSSSGQLRTAEKSNEITAVPELLRRLELAGCIVTLDAMSCQKAIARAIHEADAD